MKTGPGTCSKCGGYVHARYGDKLCINCGWSGPTVIADHRHNPRLGQAPTYADTVSLADNMRRCTRKGNARQRARRRREAAG